jgi:hypothetical protein
MKYFIFTVFILAAFTACNYFDPMHGLQFLDYGDPYSLSFSGGPAVLSGSGETSYNNVGVDGDNVYVVYFDFGKFMFVLSRSQDGGSHWRDAHLSSSHCFVDCMSVVAGNIYISYVQDGSLFCIVSYDGGTTIRSARIGPAVTSGDGYTGITGYGNDIYISYSNKQDDLCDILCAYSKDKGRTFSVSTVESSAHTYASSTAVAYNHQTEKVYISYQHQTGDYSDVGFAMSSDLDTWETDFFADSDHQTSGIIAHGNGNIHLVHTGNTGPTYLNSINDGSDWSGGLDIDTSCLAASDISFVKDGTILYTAYYDVLDQELKVSIYNGTWTTRTVDPDTEGGGSAGRKCSIDASDNLVFVSYVSIDQKLMLSKSTDGGATWNTDKR